MSDQINEEAVQDVNDLEEALNELGTLADTRRKTKPWGRRYPLRRQLERELSWCSSSSSGSSSVGSRRSSSSSSCSSTGSFSSLGYSSSFHSRSSLAGGSIAETPTGPAPTFGQGGVSTSLSSQSSAYQSSGSFSGASSSSSLCSSLDLDQAPGVISSAYKTNYSKFRRIYHHKKPYAPSFDRLIKPRRRSLQLGGVKEESHDYNINLSHRCAGLNLSDSEASSGSGTGTPPPPILSCGEGGLPKRPFQLNFKEVRSNPSSPSKAGLCGGLTFSAALQQPSHTQSSYLPTEWRTEEAQALSMPTGQCCPGPPCGGGASGNGSSSGPASAFLTRSKSLDDLTVLLSLQEDPQFRQHALRLFPNPQLFRQQLESRMVNSSGSSCDILETNIIENVLQRISRLEM